MATVTARIDDQLGAELERLAKSTERSRSYLVGQAIAAYLRRERWQIAAIQEAVEEADRDEFASDEKARDTFAKWGVNFDAD